jgi:hypothetical protein
VYARPGTPRAIRQKPVWTYWLGASALGIATNVGAGSRRTAGVAVRTAVQETAPIQYGVTLPWLAICAGGSSCQRSNGAAVPQRCRTRDFAVGGAISLALAVVPGVYPVTALALGLPSLVPVLTLRYRG